MGHPKEKSKNVFNYADYLTWSEDERWELIDGEAYDMSPSPSREHQRIVGELHRQFANFLLDKDCEVYVAPFDVRLPVSNEADDIIKNVVQPDIVAICDKSKLDDRGCRGAPDLAVEVLSTYTASKDHIKKLRLYETVGVKEYWIVHPADKIVMVRKLDNKKYMAPDIYSAEDKIEVGIIGGLVIDLGPVFKKA